MGEQALRLTRGLDPSASNLIGIGEAVGVEAARWAFLQWDLRARAKVKFSKASEMLFTREALEQASAEPVARYHASQFPVGARVADLTCGIGGDLIALASRGPAVGFELDPERAAYARHNLKIHGLDAEILVGDGLASATEFEYGFCDPSRRRAGRRHVQSAHYDPPLDQVVNATKAMKRVGIKLSPMISDAELEPHLGRTEFVSHSRECKEAILWLGNSVDPGREAVHVESGSRLAASESAQISEKAERFVFEADPAAIRAHALGTLCREHALAELGDSNGFLTGSHEISSPWLRIFEAILELPFDKKTLKRELAARGLSTEAVKNRGIRLDANALALDLRSPGSELVVVLIYPSSDGMKAVIAQEIHP